MKSHKLYKYRSGDDDTFERDLNTLEENCYFAPSHKLLNDPNETFILDNFDIQSKFYNRLFKSKTGNVKEKYNRLLKRREEVGIYSLSKTFNDELLWAHYGDSHKGFCIEYDEVKLFDTFSNENLYTFPVKYSNIPPQIGLNDIINNDVLKIVKKLSGTKSKSWKYENEVRIIRDKPGKQVYNHKALTSIIFGVNMEHAKKDKIITKFSDRGINFYQMTTKKNLYGFKAELLFHNKDFKETYLTTIPAEVTKSKPVNYQINLKTYDWITKKGIIEIILDQEVGFESLNWIAELIKKHIFINAEKIFMFYYINFIDTTTFSWATSHYSNNKFEIKIDDYQ